MTASSMTMVAAAMTPWAELVAQAGAGPDLEDYLKARNMNRTATLALMGTDEATFRKNVVAPYTAGYKDGAGNA